MDLVGLNYVHNVWLDIANAAGLLPFILVSLYSILTMVNVVILLFRKGISVEVKLMLTSTYAAMFLYDFVERGLETSVMFWSVGTFISGVISGMIARDKTNSKPWYRKRKALRNSSKMVNLDKKCL